MGDNARVRCLKTEASDAVRAGQSERALSLLEAAADIEGADPEIFLRLAAIHRSLGNLPKALEAVGKSVRLAPANFLALLMLGSLQEAVGSPLRANRTYREALRLCPPEQALPDMVRRQVDRARIGAARHDAWVRGATAWSGDLLPAERRRIEGFRDSILRAAAAGPTTPEEFLVPGLIETNFFDPADFAGVSDLAHSSEAVLDEYLALTRARPELSSPLPDHLDEGTGRWSMIPLLRNGQPVAEFASHCPQTMKLFGAVDSPALRGVSPSLHFSILDPHTHIAPHTGICNARLIIHWPLLVPHSCRLRVGGETRGWQIGTPLIFDDTIEHEAWNDSDAVRIVLIGDLWRPELSTAERAAITALMGEL